MRKIKIQYIEHESRPGGYTESDLYPTVLKEDMEVYHLSDFSIDVFAVGITCFFRSLPKRIRKNLYGKDESIYKMIIPAGTEVVMNDFEIRVELTPEMEIYKMNKKDFQKEYKIWYEG